MYALFLHALTHIFAQWDLIGVIHVSMESFKHLKTFLSLFSHPSMQPSYILACLGPYLCSMGSDQRSGGIYRILVTYLISQRTYHHLSMQASILSSYILACLGTYLAQLGHIREIEVSMELL